MRKDRYYGGIVAGFLLTLLLVSTSWAQYFHVSGHVTDSRGAGIWGVDLDVEDSVTGDPLNITGDHTDLTGFYDIILPVGGFNIEYNAPPGQKLVSEMVRNVLVQSDMVINVVLEDGLYLSGRVTDDLGAGVNQVDIDVDDSDTGLRIITPRDNTNGSGDYQVVVPSGTFDLTYEPPPGVQLAARALLRVDITGDTVVDVSLEVGYTVSGLVVDEGGTGILDVDLDVDDLTTGASVPTPRDNTDNTGHYSVVLPAGHFSIIFDPLMRDDLAAEMIDSVAVTADTALDTVTLRAGVSLSGIVEDWQGTPVPDADLDVIDRSASRTLPTPQDNTDSTGFYRVTIPPGVYDLRMTPPAGSNFLEGFLPSVDILSDTTVDFVLGDVAGIEDEYAAGENLIPKGFVLSQNFPNPFNPQTSINFVLPEADADGAEGKSVSKRVLLEIFDMRGHRVRVLVDGELASGSHSVIWDGRDESGTTVVSGTYLYRLDHGSFRSQRKMVLLK